MPDDTKQAARPGASRLPTGVALTPLNPAFREQPHAILDRLRAEDPVHRDGQFDRVFLTRFEDAREVLADRSLSVDPRRAREGAFSRVVAGLTGQDGGTPSLLHLDDPDHKRLRGLVSRAFNQRSVDAFRPRIRAIAEGLLDRVADAAAFDVMDAYAVPRPTIVIAEMLGVDPAQQADFKRWSDGLVHVFNPMRTAQQVAELHEAEDNLVAFFLDAIAQRRAARGTDLISALVTAEEDGEHLTETEIMLTCNLLLVAGNMTTTDLIGNGVLALLRHPCELAKLREDPALAAGAVEEVLRYEPPVVQLGRITTAPYEIGGVALDAGESISVSLLAAAHDPAANPEPGRFDIGRRDPRHVSFGGGVHFCLGAPLARAEAQIALPLLFERFPGLAIDQARPIRRKAAPIFNGLEALWVCGPRANETAIR
ncbi:MAG TPA: cytochrome P450 [Acidisphaera sp.]|nr:cytochrome P450 [Acidisphaera sp.]